MGTLALFCSIDSAVGREIGTPALPPLQRVHFAECWSKVLELAWFSEPKNIKPDAYLQTLTIFILPTVFLNIHRKITRCSEPRIVLSCHECPLPLCHAVPMDKTHAALSVQTCASQKL